MDGLTADTNYKYAVFANNRRLAEGGFTTAPVADEKGIFTWAFGSCFHKIGLHNPNLIQLILDRKPHAMMLLGDIAVDDRENRINMHQSDCLLRDVSAPWRQLSTNVPLYTSWDDHDYFNDDLGGIPEGFTEADREAVREVWHQNWVNPENDPYEINNLALNPDYKEVLETMRSANRDWLIKIKDTGFMPEDERVIQAGEQTIDDYFQSGEVPIEQVINAAETALFGQASNLDKLKDYLESDSPAIRYWAATGLLILVEQARSVLPELRAAADDESVSVATVAAEALYKLGVKEDAYKAFARALQTDREFAQTQAMNAIYLIDDDSEMMRKEVLEAYARMDANNRSKYNYRSAMNLFEKWGIEVDEVIKIP